MTIREFKTEDWEAVSKIYAEGAVSGKAVFHYDNPTWEKWDASHLMACRLVAEENGVVVGWTALRPVSDKCMDKGTAKVSAYVLADARGKGVGKALMGALIEASEREGIWSLQPIITHPSKMASHVRGKNTLRLKKDAGYLIISSSFTVAWLRKRRAKQAGFLPQDLKLCRSFRRRGNYSICRLFCIAKSCLSGRC